MCILTRISIAARSKHQSHADEKRFREDAITRLQEEQSKIQNELIDYTTIGLDGFIEPDFFEQKAPEVATNTSDLPINYRIPRGRA